MNDGHNIMYSWKTVVFLVSTIALIILIGVFQGSFREREKEEVVVHTKEEVVEEEILDIPSDSEDEDETNTTVTEEILDTPSDSEDEDETNTTVTEEILDTPSDSEDETNTTVVDPGFSQKDAHIHINKNCIVSSGTLRIKEGDTFMLRNLDFVEHTVVIDGDAYLLNPLGITSITAFFSEGAGTYKYTCDAVKSAGTIVVTAM